MSNQEGHVSAWAWIIALAVTCVSGGAMAVSWLVTWPDTVLAAASLGFVGGLLGFAIAAYVEARRSGSGLVQALKRGVRTFLRALWEFFP